MTALSLRRLAGITALSATVCLPMAVFACDTPQQASLTWNGTDISSWTVEPGQLRTFVLPNGFNLGLRITPTQGEYLELSLFDAGHADMPLLTTTYGGTNSFQGYGARGGADRVTQLGDPGILLTLVKEPCAPAASAR